MSDYNDPRNPIGDMGTLVMVACCLVAGIVVLAGAVACLVQGG